MESIPASTAVNKGYFARKTPRNKTLNIYSTRMRKIHLLQFSDFVLQKQKYVCSRDSVSDPAKGEVRAGFEKIASLRIGRGRQKGKEKGISISEKRGDNPRNKF